MPAERMATQEPPDEAPPEDGGLSIVEVFAALRRKWALLVFVPPLLGSAAYFLTFLLTPVFTAVTVIIPPQQAQSSAASALASLGGLASLAGGAAGIRTSADQYVALMHSRTVSDRIIDRFDLIKTYGVELRVDARKRLLANVRIAANKKDGLITVEVDNPDPRRAAEMANRYVDELRAVTATLAVSEAQQRRMFFEKQMEQSRDRLTQAQLELQASGFNAGALRAEPKAAAEEYARLKAQVTATEVRLQSLRDMLAEHTPEVQQQQTLLAALRQQLARTEQPTEKTGTPGYVSKYRDFKYHEALFEVYARQFELARIDESREGAIVQVVDVAVPPERKSRPQRLLTAIITTAASAVLLAILVLFRHSAASGRQNRSVLQSQPPTA